MWCVLHVRRDWKAVGLEELEPQGHVALHREAAPCPVRSRVWQTGCTTLELALWAPGGRSLQATQGSTVLYFDIVSSTKTDGTAQGCFDEIKPWHCFIYLLLEISINVHIDTRMTFDRNIELELLRRKHPLDFPAYLRLL